MKIALVHDYIREYGGAERVLRVLADMFPEAPIYTAFRIKNSSADKEFKDRQIKESCLAPLIKHGNLYSPLRFLIPSIWKSMDLSAYDLVITSSSWYITRGFKVGPKTKIICYCHSPPRWLYGYQTSIEWQRFWPVRIYGQIVAHFLRLYDFQSAQKVDYFIANSKNTAARIKKFFRRDSTVIYPPVEIEKIKKATQGLKPENYFLITSRIVGAKGIEMAAETAKKAKVPIKIIGEPAGLRWFGGQLDKLKNKWIEFIGRIPDEELYQYYGKCKAFLALAIDEDFGMAPVEAMAAGRPVIAFLGGGYLETIIEGKTGEFFNKPTAEALTSKLQSFKVARYRPEDCRKQAEKFSKERFIKEIRDFVEKRA